MRKNYTEEQLRNAFAEGKSNNGAARVLGCDPKTFKKYWDAIGAPTPVPSEQPDLYPDTEYADQNVEAIVNEHRKNKTENETYAIIIEITDRIDGDKRKLDVLEEEISRFEDYLRKMKL